MKTKRQAGWLFIGAIGVVFGDIGTSPLYALQSIFTVSGLQLLPSDIYGIISLILWSIMIIVTFKYVSLLMRVNNHGEGGIMALVGLVRHTNTNKKHLLFFTLIGFIGISLSQQHRRCAYYFMYVARHIAIDGPADSGDC